MEGACFIEGCSLSASHLGPHDQTCPGCDGLGRSGKGLACGRCGGIGRIDEGRDLDWRFNAHTKYWFADVDGGWRKDGTTVFVWPDLGGSNWKWLVKERAEDHPHKTEKTGHRPQRWEAMDEVEREAALLRSQRGL